MPEDRYPKQPFSQECNITRTKTEENLGQKGG